MAASYEYDETGQFSFFALTFLLLVLVPYTIAVLRSSPASRLGPSPHPHWNAKAQSVLKSRSSAAGLGIGKRHLVLATGWATLAYVAWVASGVQANKLMYDPFDILGIDRGLDEKGIKKHYKRLSLKFHPDKLRNAENTTVEEANAKFVDLTKAYKVLTDDVIRRNFELYGHPDGKQDTAMGIALPKWIVDSKNNGWVIGVYGIAFGLLLPFFVGRWWSGSGKSTKDGVLTSTATLYFLNLKEDSSYFSMINLLAASDEFKSGPTATNAQGAEKAAKRGGKAWKQIEDSVKEALEHAGVKVEDKVEIWEGRRWARRTRTLLLAHLLRVRIEDVSLLKEKAAAVTRAHQLTQSMVSIALAHNWLSTYLCIIAVQQSLVQAIHPRLPPLLQLPGIEVEEALLAAKKQRTWSIQDLVAMKSDDRSTYFKGDVEKALAVAKVWPRVELLSAKFQVVGEKVVTPGAVIQFTLKLRLSPPGSKPSINKSTSTASTSDSDSSDADVKAEETSVEQLIGRKKEGEDGECRVPIAHAPYFPIDSSATYRVFVGDHKLNRVFMQPVKFTGLGYDVVRTIKCSFQAPQGAGLYTFQAYIKCDKYVGTDAQTSMQLRVSTLTKEGEEGGDGDDDISEPDEDTIAGQMAVMKGLPTKKRRGGDEGDDDTSGTEESDSDDGSESSWGTSDDE